MENKDTWSFKLSDLFTIPNIITYCRFILIVPFVFFFLSTNYIASTVCIALSGMSDCFDGLIARKFNQVTPLGKILDPIADKFTLISVVMCMVIYVPIVIPVLVLLIVKDMLMLAGGTNLIKKGITPPSAKWYGKIATVMFYVSVCIIVFLKAVINYENYALDFCLFTATALLMLFALFQYGKLYFEMIKEYKEKTVSTVKVRNNKDN